MSRSSSGITLALNAGYCRTGCGTKASVFGYCSDHADEFLATEFERIVGEGFADREQPPCFDSQPQWVEYAVAFDLAQRQTNSPVRRRKVDHCRDCTPGHRDAMIAEGRCRHPETVFVMTDRASEVVGIRLSAKAENWEKAMMGMLGVIVSMPAPDVVNAVVEKLNAANAVPRKRGRPAKVRTNEQG